MRVILELKKDSPVFVAQNLSNLPPISINNVDILYLLQDLQSMKSHIQLLTSGQSELTKAVKSVAERQLATPLPHHTMPVHQTVVASSNASSATTAAPRLPSSMFSCDSDVYTSSSDSGDSTSEESSDDSVAIISNSTWAKSIAKNSKRKIRKAASRTDQPKLSQSPHRGLVVRGKGHNERLQASERNPDRRSETEKPNRQCTGIFVTRLSSRTTTQQVERNVHVETGLTGRAEKLDTRYNTYCYFYIQGDRRLRDQLLSADIWPEGTLVKPFLN